MNSENEIKSLLTYILNARDMKHYLQHILFSVVLGIASGLGAVAFHYLISCGQKASLFTQISLSSYSIIAFPVIGAVIILLMVTLFPSLALEKGVVSAIKALISNNGYISLKTTVFNFTASLVSIGTGAPLGPEAPAAQIGCGIGSFMSRKLNLSKSDVVMYTAAAGGAAISAVFNAPIAGVFFGIEVLLLNDIKNNALSPLIIASVTSDLLSRSIMGDVRVFSFPSFLPATISDYPHLIGLGILCGLFSLLYSALSVKIRAFFARQKYQYFMLPVVSLIFGIVLLKMPHLYGVGYDSISMTANGHFSIQTLILIFILKFFFVMAFLAAGGYGGIFAPSLVIGAVGGYIFSSLMNTYLGMTSNAVLYCLAGMGGMLAGMNSVPLTAIILVFEMTNDYRLVLPLMMTSVISYVFTMNYNKHTVYAKALLGSGIDVTRRGDADILGSLKVRDLGTKPSVIVKQNAYFSELLSTVLSSDEGTVFVVDEDNRLCGIVSLNNIRQTIAVSGMESLFIVSDLMTPFAAVTLESSISDAAEASEKCGTPLIPVVDSLETLNVTGSLSQHDIIAAYNNQLEHNASDEFFIRYSYRY